MSQEQSKFIRQLKIVLISVLGPFIITGLLVVASDHSKTGSNTIHIKVMEDKFISNDMMVIYLDEWRRAQVALVNWQTTHEAKDLEQFMFINNKMDQLRSEMMPFITRGKTPKLQ